MEDGFEFEGTWITDPHWEPSHRWRFDTEHDACLFYGFPDNFHKLWHATETKENNMNETALERAIPDWLYRKSWWIAKEIHSMEQMLTATGHEWHEALDEVRRNLEHMED